MSLQMKVPVGTLAAYGGDVAGSRLPELREQGWLLCDGRGYSPRGEYAEIFSIIGYFFGVEGKEDFRVPDLRGVFIRGTDHTRGMDPDAAARSTGDRVGSQQGCATARPESALAVGIPQKPAAPPSSVDAAGKHTHATPHIPTGYVDTALALGGPTAPEFNSDERTTSQAGAHSHTVVTGGDAETRPENTYLHYLIKFRADKPGGATEGTVETAVETATGMGLNVPIGTTAPFGGDITDAATSDALKAQGWLGCIGQQLDTRGEYADLFGAIGHIYGGAGSVFQPPDLRGLFMAGPTDALPIGRILRKSTTAAPRAAFATSTDGAHAHTLHHVPESAYLGDWCLGHWSSAWTEVSSEIVRGGAHAHSIIKGGDSETRPVNLALDYIIKFREA